MGAPRIGGAGENRSMIQARRSAARSAPFAGMPPPGSGIARRPPSHSPSMADAQLQVYLHTDATGSVAPPYVRSAWDSAAPTRECVTSEGVGPAHGKRAA